MTDIRVANTLQLKRLIKDADDCDFNRRFRPEINDLLDPDGWHVLQVALPYHRASAGFPTPKGAKPWPDHHRCLVLIKQKGSMEAIEGYLDVRVTAFERLVTAETLAKASEEKGYTDVDG